MICLPIRRTLAGDRPGLSLQTEAAQCIYTSLQMFANRKKPFVSIWRCTKEAGLIYCLTATTAL